jgi:hypothetical protein
MPSHECGGGRMDYPVYKRSPGHPMAGGHVRI